ncbi:MAG: membrane integrity-associated transporter subunit PqiC [Verrucomicrobia bacterium]|nr:MAG: membrane integrity-associated transporter subunit PqiC [Verrucomicrobiota bacterium]
MKPTLKVSTRLLSALGAAGILSASLVVSGCSVFPKPRADPTRHFVLTTPALPESAKQSRLPEVAGFKIGLRAVRVAPYLDGKSMIVRRGENEVEYLDYARWAEPLAVGVARLVDARLSASDRVARVLPQPFPFDVVRDVDVSITVERCEGRVLADGSGVASLVCTVELIWAHEGAGSGEVILRDTFVVTEQPWQRGDTAGLAAALSTAIAELADYVVASLPAEVE